MCHFVRTLPDGWTASKTRWRWRFWLATSRKETPSRWSGVAQD